jgi:hypothetical protein
MSAGEDSFLEPTASGRTAEPAHAFEPSPKRRGLILIAVMIARLKLARLLLWAARIAK